MNSCVSPNMRTTVRRAMARILVKNLWSVNQDSEMTLFELVDFCRRSHRMAPFTNYNGNTFAAIVRALIIELNLPATQSALGRSLAGHIVAGVAGEDELKAFEEFCKGLE